MQPTGPSEPLADPVEFPAAAKYSPEYSRSWVSIAAQNINEDAVQRINAKDYRAAGVAMANGVIERGGDMRIEAQAAQALWDQAPKTADPQFLELIDGYRTTLHEYLHRGDE